MLVKKSTKLKQILIIFMLAATLIFASIIFTLVPHAKSNVCAVTEMDTEEFAANSTSSSPVAPSSSKFVELTGVGYSNKDLVTAGIVNLTTSEYLKYPRRLNADNSVNQYVLAINSTVKRTIKDKNNENSDTSGNVEVETSHSVNYGYKTAFSITLSKNSFYQFSVYAHTSNRNGIGSFALLNADDGDSVLLQKTAISTPNNGWQEYSLLIATDNIKTYNVKLAMILHGEGMVMFDTLSMKKLDNKQDFDNLALDTYHNACLNNDYVPDISVDGNNLSFTGAHAIDNDLCFEMNKTTTLAEVNGFSLTLDKHILYRVTVDVKAQDLSGTVNLKLVPKDEDEPESSVVSSLAIAKSANYTSYEFWIKANPLNTSEYVFKLDISDASGTMYINRIEVQKCTTTQYSAASTGSNVAKLDLSSSVSTSSPYVSNGQFNISSVEDPANPYPLSANNWTVETDSHAGQKAGIVNLSDKDFMLQQHLSFAEQLPSDNSNLGHGNVLMMYPAAGKITYSSSTSTVSSGNYKFSLDIYTYSNAKVDLVLRNNGEDKVICSLVASGNNWQTKNLYVKAGYASSTVFVRISTENYGTTGTTFVDEVKFESGISDEEFNSAQTKANLTNLVNENFYDIQDVNLDIVKADLYEYGTPELNSILRSTAQTWSNTNALRIHLNEFGLGNLSSKIGFDLASGNYYHLSFSVYTNLLPQLEADYDGDYGLKFMLSGFSDNSFDNVKSSNGYAIYNFYINATNTQTSKFEIEFGNENALLSGEAFIGNIAFNELTDEEFDKIKTNATTKILTTPVEENNDDTPSTDEDEETNKKGINWDALPYLISSIIFGISIIVAVVGIILRKVKFKKPAKKTQNEYDRTKTVSKQYYARKAIQLKEEKLAELNNELKALTDERAKYEETYKSDLSHLRELKIKRANKADIAKLEKELKQNQKASAAIGVNIARVESDIDYVNSASFMAALTKRIQAEGQDADIEQENTETNSTQPAPDENNKLKDVKTKTADKKLSKKGSATDKNEKTSSTKSAKSGKSKSEK